MKAVIFDYNRTLFDPDKDALYPEVIEVLGGLKKTVLMALIAKGDANRMEKIRNLGLLKYFKLVIINQEKSVADFEKCVKELGLPAKDIFVVGDRVNEEIRCGKSIGAVTVWFRNGKFKDELPKGKEEEPDYTIDDLKKLFEIIR